MNAADLITTLAIYALPVLLAITMQEVAQGDVARLLGDDTATRLGRLSFNPFKHIHPIGTLLVPVLVLLATGGQFLLGYAKPMPVDYSQFKNPRRDIILVALAGPAANLAQALLWNVALMLLQAAGVQERFFLGMCGAGVLVNLVMFAINLFPLPPLSGGRILANLLPPRAGLAFERIAPYGVFITLGLIITGLLSTLWLRPIMTAADRFIQLLLIPLSLVLS